MKRILISILVLAGLVQADSGANYNDRLSRELAQAEYMPDCSYKFTCTFAATPRNKELLQLADGYYLVNQACYWWGLNMEPTNILFNNKVCKLTVKDNVYTYKAEKGKLPVIWTQNQEGTGSQPRPSGKDLNVVVESNGKDSRITLSYGKCPITDVFEMPGVVLDANQLKFNKQSTVYNYNLTIEKKDHTWARVAIVAGLLAIFALGIVLLTSRKKTATSGS